MRRILPRIAVCPLLLLALGLASPAAAKDSYAVQRNRMVEEDVAGAGVKDPRVLQSMRDTPRHEFMLSASRPNAYYDMAVAIGEGQTISPPFVVAYMTEQLLPQPTDKVLEIGTGSGYQAAILSPLVKEVYTIEIVKPLGERAAKTLKRLKYKNVFPKIGDGYQGWEEHAPFDKIIVTCSPEAVPQKLIDQLREGGRMIVPVGKRYEQTLYLFEKQEGKLNRVALLPTLFVPMTGKAEAGRVEQPDPLKPSVNNGGFERSSNQAAEAGPDEPGKPNAGAKANEVTKSDETDKPAGAAGKPATADGATVAPFPIGWHYQRQLRLIEGADAPEGKNYVTLSNAEEGRGAHALQGIAVDGRKIAELTVTLFVKGTNIRPGAGDDQQPVLAFTFYDENRVEVGFTWVGPWQGTFPWQKFADQVRVPPKAREMIVRISMSGATGEISFDDIRISPVKR